MSVQIKQETQQRRLLLKITTASLLGLSLPFPSTANAMSGIVKLPPIPENVLSPEAALERLKMNVRIWSRGKILLHVFLVARTHE